MDFLVVVNIEIGSIFLKQDLEAHPAEKNGRDIPNGEHDPAPKPGRIDLLLSSTDRIPNIVRSFLSSDGKHHFLSGLKHIGLYKAWLDGYNVYAVTGESVS